MTTEAENMPEAATPAAPVAPQQPQQAPRLEVDDSRVQSCYANFCRVNGTPEELIIDFEDL